MAIRPSAELTMWPPRYSVREEASESLCEPELPDAPKKHDEQPPRGRFGLVCAQLVMLCRSCNAHNMLPS